MERRWIGTCVLGSCRMPGPWRRGVPPASGGRILAGLAYALPVCARTGPIVKNSACRGQGRALRGGSAAFFAFLPAPGMVPAMDESRCKAFVIAGTHSGCGKTLVSLAVMAALRARGLAVAPFKAGRTHRPHLHAAVCGRDSPTTWTPGCAAPRPPATSSCAIPGLPGGGGRGGHGPVRRLYGSMDEGSTAPGQAARPARGPGPGRALPGRSVAALPWATPPSTRSSPLPASS